MKAIISVLLTLILLVAITPSTVHAQSTNIDITAMKAVIQQDAGLSDVTSNSIAQVDRNTDAGLDLTANFVRQYVTEAKRISLDACPDKFAKAYNNHLIVCEDLAEIISSHPHLSSGLESIFGPSSIADQEGYNAWKQRFDARTIDMKKSWDQVLVVVKSYRLGENPPDLILEVPEGSANSLVTNLLCECHDGAFHDSVYLTNDSGQDLTRVRVAIFVTGESGARRRVTGEYYWSTWASGEKKSVAIASGDSVIHIKFADLVGHCDQGTIGHGSVSH